MEKEPKVYLIDLDKWIENECIDDMSDLEWIDEAEFEQEGSDTPTNVFTIKQFVEAFNSGKIDADHTFIRIIPI